MVAIHFMHYNFARVLRAVESDPPRWKLDSRITSGRLRKLFFWQTEMNHTVRASLVVIWAGWIAYTCFKRAIHPPQENSSWWHMESYALDKDPLVRTLNVLAGILVLVIGVAVARGNENPN